jgi:hypothetical protein
MASLMLNHKRFGTLGLIDICSPFTRGQLSLVYHLKKVLEYALENNHDYQGNAEESLYWIDRLIQGFAIEEKIVLYHLAKRNWKIDEDYFIINFSAPDQLLDEDLLKMYCRKVKTILNQGIAFTFENAIISILRKKDYLLSDPDLLNQLDQLADLFGLNFGISMFLPTFTEIKTAYIQSKVALTEGLKKNPHQTHHFFADCYATHLVHSLSDTTSLKSICHPKIQQLRLYDEKNNTDLIYNLTTYLQNGRNIQHTADKLFIHRNTLTYRLEKIEKILELPLDDEKNFLHLYFSCILVDYL